MSASNPEIITRRPEQRVTVHIWRPSTFLAGLYQHLTDRQRFCIGHIALQTYERPDPQNPGAMLPGKFINFLPPVEMTTILKIQFGKTPNQALSQQYRDDAARFLELERPCASVDLYSLNPRTIEIMYNFLMEREQGFTWSSFSIPFFRGNSMSSTKLALLLLTAGAGGQLNLPLDVSIPILREMTTLFNRVKQAVCVDGIRLDLNLTLSELNTKLMTHGAEVRDVLTSVITTLTSFVAITSGECEAIVNHLRAQEMGLITEIPEEIENSLTPEDHLPSSSSGPVTPSIALVPSTSSDVSVPPEPARSPSPTGP
jgi:hypothetical protein